MVLMMQYFNFIGAQADLLKHIIENFVKHVTMDRVNLTGDFLNTWK